MGRLFLQDGFSEKFYGVFGRHCISAVHRCSQLGGFSAKISSAVSALHEGEALRKQSTDDTAQDIAGTALGHPRRSGSDEIRGLPIGHQGGGTFQQQADLIFSGICAGIFQRRG